MKHNEAKQNTDLSRLISEPVHEYILRNSTSDLNPELEVEIVFSYYDEELNSILVFVDPSTSLGINYVNTLIRINISDFSIEMRRLNMLLPAFSAEEARHMIKDLKEEVTITGKIDSFEVDEKLIPLFVIKRYALESQGEFFNIVKKHLGREVSKEDIVNMIESAKRYLEN